MLHIAIRTRRGAAGTAHRLEGWAADSAGTITAPAEITLLSGTGPGSPRLRLSAEPAQPALTASASGGTLHYFRFADATLRPLPPAPPTLAFARGDAYIAVSPGASLVAAGAGTAGLGASSSIARFIHLRDYFNAERLALSVLEFLAEQTGPAGLAEDVTVVVVEAR